MKKQLLTLTLILLVAYTHAQCFGELRVGAHVVTVKSDGTLWAWGNNVSGQLNTGNTVPSPSPLQLGTDTDWVSAGCGLITTFGIKQDGTLWGLGDNGYGGLGIGVQGPNYYLNFQQITTFNDWVDIRGAYLFTLGLRGNGTIWAWGLGDEGQMGNGTTPLQQPTPTQVGSDTDWASIAVSWNKTAIAIKQNGTVWGWGANTGYILYAGSSVTSYTSPTQLNTGTDWVKASLGSTHVLAQKSDGTLWSWGSGDALGVNATYSDADAPLQIGSDTWLSFAAGYNTSYGVKSNGTLWAWGNNDMGELGDGTTINHAVPVQIGTDTDWVFVNGKYINSPVLAVKQDGSVWAWGDNMYGSYGNGTYTDSLTPIEIPGICVSTPLSTTEFEQPTIRLHPNPTTDKVTLNTSLNLTQYTLTNLLGQTVAKGTLTEGQKEIDMRPYSTGTYIMQLTTATGATHAYKIVKK